jgi:ATP-dependent Clp protease adaptor protein ClpS
MSAMSKSETLVATAEPGVIEEVETETRLARPWNVIVHDDPITLMTYVTLTLQKVFGYAHDKAHRMMMEVHNHGRSVVWTGAREQAELYVFKLHAAQLRATLEQVDE